MTCLVSRHDLSAVVLLCLTPCVWSNCVAADQQVASEAPRQASTSPGHQHRGGTKQIRVKDAREARITFWHPDLSTQILTAKNDLVSLPRTGVDNYHALVAERNLGDQVITQIRYVYLQGRPSKLSPSELTAADKTRLEIVPDPIPREHYHYFSDQTWGFILRLDGEPLVDTPVVLETDNGGRVEGTTDQAGRVNLLIPDDFPKVRPGERDERTAEFRVLAQAEVDDTQYQTVLSAAYRINPQHWQSFGWGLAAAGFGFLVGGLIGRVHHDKTGGKKA